MIAEVAEAGLGGAALEVRSSTFVPRKDNKEITGYNVA